jgi:hypothetical protein
MDLSDEYSDVRRCKSPVSLGVPASECWSVMRLKLHDPLLLLLACLAAAAACGCAPWPPVCPPPTDHPVAVIPPAAAGGVPAARGTVIHVPTRLTVTRGPDTVSVSVDRDALETTQIPLTPGLSAGVRSDLFVYREGATRSDHARRSGLCSALDFNLGTSIFNAGQDGLPIRGERYVVEMDVAVFETDVPPAHMWSPEGGSRRFRVLWQRTLRKVVD